MSVYNGEQFLSEAIESVLAQTFTDFEFLIVDDGSCDSSPQIISHYASLDARIRPIIRENKGLIASLNEILEIARAPIVARMDADDASMPDRFAVQKAFLEQNPDHGVVGAWSDEFDEHGRPIAYTESDQPVAYRELLYAIESREQLICHPTAMYRRDIVRAVGGYHAAFRHCEDYDLWLRLANATKLANVPQRLLKYRRHSGQVTLQHATDVHFGAEIAYLAYCERRDGRPDPTANLAALPAFDELDQFFHREGARRQVLEKVVLGLRYSLEALRGDGYELMLRHVREGGRREGMWRTVARLARYNLPLKALRLLATLLTSRAAAPETA